MKTKALDEYVMQKCEEMIMQDEEYQKLTQEIIEKENEIRKQFLEFSRLTSKILAYSETLIYKSVLK